MNDPASENPLLREWQNAHRYWCMALISPIVYFLIGLWLDRLELAGPAPEGGLAAHPVALGIFITLWTAMLLGVLWSLKKRIDCTRGVSDDGKKREPDEWAEAWRRQFWWMLGLSDSAALAGLIYFYFIGVPVVMLLGGIVAYIGYAFTYPRRSELL